MTKLLVLKVKFKWDEKPGCFTRRKTFSAGVLYTSINSNFTEYFWERISVRLLFGYILN